MKQTILKTLFLSTLSTSLLASPSVLAHENAMGFSSKRFDYTLPQKINTLCQQYIQKLPKDEQQQAKENGCMHIDIKLASFNQPQYQWIADDLNGQLSADPKQVRQMFDALTHQFYQELKEHKSYRQVLNTSRDVKWISLSPRLAQFIIEDYEYTGGAHGLYSASVIIYDLQQKKRLTLDDVVRSPADKQKLESLVYQAYQNLFVYAKDFKEHEKTWKFEMSENFYFTPQGMSFFYNPYHIGPYAMGSVSLNVKTADVKVLIKPEYWADEFTHFDDEDFSQQEKISWD